MTKRTSAASLARHQTSQRVCTALAATAPFALSRTLMPRVAGSTPSPVKGAWERMLPASNFGFLKAQDAQLAQLGALACDLC
jgi:hypothetical protein